MPTTTQATRAGTTTWRIDPAHSQAEFEVRHLMFAKVRGRFDTLSGTITLGPDGAIDSSARVAAVIESASIDTNQSERDAHLRSADFFDVEKFPELTFTSTRVRKDGDGLAIEGQLTMHGVMKHLTFEAEEMGRTLDPWGKQRIGFSASATIDRRDFGLTWNQALEAGGIMVGHDVTMTLEIQATMAAD